MYLICPSREVGFTSGHLRRSEITPGKLQWPVVLMLLQGALCNDILCESDYCSFVAQTSSDQTILMGWLISETHHRYQHPHTSDKYWPHFWVDSVAVQQFKLLHLLCLNASTLRNLKVFVRCCIYSKSVLKVVVINYFGIYFRLFC